MNTQLRCRRTACQSEQDVICKHKYTDEMYCTVCARLINRACNENVVLFPFPNNSIVIYEDQEATVVINQHTGGYLIRCADGKEIKVSFVNLREKS
jgi:hypothetical protein